MTTRRALVVLPLVVAVLAATTWYALSRPDETPVPATKRAIAAVAVDVLDIEPTSFDVNPEWDVPDPLGVEIRWRPVPDEDSHYLRVGVEPADEAVGCRPREPYDGCETWDAEDGEMQLRWQLGHPEEDPGILVLTYVTGEEERSVVYAGELLERDPRDHDLPLGVDDLGELLTDDRFSATTTREMVETELPKWPDDDSLGDPVATTPAVVAQWASHDGVRRPRTSAGPAPTGRYGDGAVGAVFRSPGRVTTVLLVAKDSGRAPTCGPGWHCRTRRGVTTGWRPGVAIAIRESRDVVVVGTVRSASIDRAPRPAWRYGAVGWDFYALEHGFAAYGTTTTRQFASGKPPRWFRGG